MEFHRRKREKIHAQVCFLCSCWHHKMSKNTDVFLRVRADYLNGFRPQRACNRKTIGSHLWKKIILKNTNSAPRCCKELTPRCQKMLGISTWSEFFYLFYNLNFLNVSNIIVPRGKPSHYNSHLSREIKRTSTPDLYCFFATFITKVITWSSLLEILNTVFFDGIQCI